MGSGRRRPDHPRSRGVYSRPSAARSRALGSSPLARGLRSHPRVGHLRAGIIPARAGFTELNIRLREIDGDHPRSRGVYAASGRSTRTAPGSSPLARGLPSCCSLGLEARRIIPARAGFTRLGPRGRHRRRDHPRSRGVYSRMPPRWRPPSGSSPLARGLLAQVISAGRARRIIPARAGFTPPATGVRPRTSGSSPLARGLPSCCSLGLEARRIIPARAGFTRLGPRGRHRRRDHPRSRGVYELP